MVDMYSERDWACNPPPSLGWADFSIMMEYIPESGHCETGVQYTVPLSIIRIKISRCFLVSLSDCVILQDYKTKQDKAKAAAAATN
jgi:hypothetical protein